MIRVAVITVSDSVVAGTRTDLSGPAVRERVETFGWTVSAVEVVPDEPLEIADAMLRLANSGEVSVILTTGGTGVAPRDVTPEATQAICNRMLDGVAEQMRGAGVKRTPFAALSRGVCGVRDKTLILNVPGSPAGAVESLEAVVELIPHALKLLQGHTKHF